MLYEVLYTNKDKKFITAKPAPAEWGAGELTATFFIAVEELTAEQLQAKYDKVIADAKAASDAIVAKRKAEAEAKAAKK